jgi:glucosylceramidase
MAKPLTWMKATFLVAALMSAHAQKINVIVSSAAGDRLTPARPLQFEPKNPSTDIDFQIHDQVTNQKILGFGASFLEAGMISLNSLPGEQQEAVLQALFDPEKGAGFTAMKAPIAATDFMSAGPWYTYDDVPGDVEMKHFSIQRDLGPNGLITYIKRARKYGTFIIQSPMDYPPDWMLDNATDRQKEDVDPRYYSALAQYYLRYLQEYEKNGVFIDYISLFNEPPGYTRITYPEINTLLTEHVGPLFDKEGVRTKIQLSEASRRQWASENYGVLLDNPKARKYISSLPYHGYDLGNFDKIAALHARYPDLPLWMTEICHYRGYSPRMPLPRYDFEDGEFWGDQIFSDLEAGASAWTYWNMILDQNGGPWLISVPHGDLDDNAQHPVVIIDRDKKAVTYTGLYYYLAHFSKFIRPGSIRVETWGAHTGVRCITFKRPDGELVTELMNSQKSDVNIVFEWRDRLARVTLPGTSISTYIWNAESQ